MSEPWPDEIRFEHGERPNETMAGLLVAVVQKARELQFFEALVDGLNLSMKVYVYSHRNKIETIVASVAVGCRHIAEIQTRLVPDTVAAGLFGMERFPDQSQINAFLRACGPAQVTHLEQAHEQLLLQHSRMGDRTLWHELSGGQRLLPVDLDHTPLATRSTRATGATRGYFGRKRSQFGYQKSVAFLGARVREVLWQQLEPGNQHEQKAVPQILAKLTTLCQAKGVAPHQILMRGDSQYGSVGSLRQYQAAGYHYLVKGYTPRTAHALAEAVPETAVWHYHGTDSNGSRLWVYDAGEQVLSGHDDGPDDLPVRTRVVLLVRVAQRTRRKHGKGAPGTVTKTVVSFEHYLTDLPAWQVPASEVIGVYNDRESEESYFRTEHDAFGAHYLRTKHKEGEAVFLWLMASTANLLRWVQASTFAETPLEKIGLTRLVTQALRIPATIIREAHRWIVLLPDTARLVRAMWAAWVRQAYQLELPLVFADSTS